MQLPVSVPTQGLGRAAPTAPSATSPHHGRPVSIKDYKNSNVRNKACNFWQAHGDYNPQQALEDLALAARRAFPTAFEPHGPTIEAINTAFEPAHRPGPVLLAAPGYVKVDGKTVERVLADPDGTLWDDDARDRPDSGPP